MIRFFPVTLLSLLAAPALTFCAPAPAYAQGKGTFIPCAQLAKDATTNRSGIKGLHYDARRRQWVAQVTAAGKLYKKTSKDKDFLAEWLYAKRAQVHKEFARVS